MELCLQFLSLCNGKDSAETDDQKKKNIAIEKQISKSKQALRKEQKILLLGTMDVIRILPYYEIKSDNNSQLSLKFSHPSEASRLRQNLPKSIKNRNLSTTSCPNLSRTCPKAVIKPVRKLLKTCADHVSGSG